MAETDFDLEAWLRRIGHSGPRTPDLGTLRAVVAAHSGTIPFENVDVLLGRPPKLDLASLQRKLIEDRRGGYCFEQNAVLRAGLTALGFSVTGLIARVIRGMARDAAGPGTHMCLRVDLPDGAYLADVGFGNETPTAPLKIVPGLEQETPHGRMRLIPVGDELTLEAEIGGTWQTIYRMAPHPRLHADYEVANWFTATHPNSPFVSNFIAARPGPGGTRATFFNGRLSQRRPDADTDRRMLEAPAEIAEALRTFFGLSLTAADLSAALNTIDAKGTRGAAHPFFS